MSKIVVKHNHIEINDYTMGDIPSLEKNFMLYDKVTHSYYTKSIHYIEEEKKLIVPRGIDIFYLNKLFDTKASVSYKCDEYDIIDPIGLKYKPRDDEQREALAFMQGRLGYSKNQQKSQLSLNLNTGKGKTYCSIANSALGRVRSAIITSALDWLQQWKECIIEYTDVLSSEIYIISGSPSIHRLLKRDISKYKFILISHDTIKSYGDKHGWDKVTELFKYMRIGYKYYDESHLNFDNMSKIDAYTNTYKTYYVTATPERSERNEDSIFQLYFKNIPSIDLFNEDEDPHTHYIALRYNSRPTPMDIKECKNAYGFDKNSYSKYVVQKDNFHKLLHVLINMALKNNMKNIFYIATNDAILTVYNWMVNNYPELKNDIGIYTSIIPKDKKDSQLDKKIILSTTKSLGTARDVKGLKMVVVLAEPFGSKVLTRQTLGRTRDKDTYYIDVIDEGFKTVKEYCSNKKEIFSKYACSMSVIKLSDNELDIRATNIINSRVPQYVTIPFIDTSLCPFIDNNHYTMYNEYSPFIDCNCS